MHQFFPELHDSQVALQRLLNLMQVKTPGSGFSLSSAIVPVVDVSSLLSEETGASLAPETAADLWTDRLGGAFIEQAFGNTYTVPLGRKAIVQMVHASIRRVAAAAPAAEARIFGAIDRVQPRVGPATPLFFELALQDNTVGAFRELHMPCSIKLRAGESIRARNQDASTGGTTYQTWGAIIMETAA